MAFCVYVTINREKITIDPNEKITIVSDKSDYLKISGKVDSKLDFWFDAYYNGDGEYCDSIEKYSYLQKFNKPLILDEKNHYKVKIFSKLNDNSGKCKNIYLRRVELMIGKKYFYKDGSYGDYSVINNIDRTIIFETVGNIYDNYSKAVKSTLPKENYLMSRKDGNWCSDKCKKNHLETTEENKVDKIGAGKYFLIYGSTVNHCEYDFFESKDFGHHSSISCLLKIKRGGISIDKSRKLKRYPLKLDIVFNDTDMVPVENIYNPKKEREEYLKNKKPLWLEKVPSCAFVPIEMLFGLIYKGSDFK